MPVDHTGPLFFLIKLNIEKYCIANIFSLNTSDFAKT